MPDLSGNGMHCHEFDSLLADAIDGMLSGAELDRFQAHGRTCSLCGPLLAEVAAGRNWLKHLPEVNPPASLVTNILASTTGVDSQRLRVNVSTPQRAPVGASWLDRLQAWIWGATEALWKTVRQPRFAMSFGMAFFSISVGLSVLGVKASDLAHIDLHPAAIRHTYYTTQARVVRYYDNIKLVYEVQAAVRELKRNVAPAEAAPREAVPEKKEHNNDTTEKPEQKQERNYSPRDPDVILASARLGPSVFHRSNPDLPVVSGTAYRRFA